MTHRVDLAELRARLAPGAWSSSVPGLYVGSCYDGNFAADFKSRKPAIWILGQRAYSIGNEEEVGYTQVMRQRIRFDIVLRLVVARNNNHAFNNDASMKAFFEAVCDRLFGWLPSQAESNMFYVASEDGEANETFITADLVVGYIVVKED